jgi:hypothetical protein
MLRLIAVLLVLGLPRLAAAQTAPVPEPVFAEGYADPLEAEFVNHWTRVLAPEPPPGTAWRAQPTTFQVEYENVPPQAQTAFEAALDLWSTHVSSPIPIKVRVTFVESEENVLGSAAPRLVANFTTALDRNTFFATALASALEARDLNPNQADIEVNLNGAFPRWYFGTDGNPPADHFDFMTVVIHELGHGLGFVGSMRVTEGLGRWGIGTQVWPIVYDRFAETDFQAQTSLLLNTERFPNFSIVLAQALQSQEVYYNGPASVSANVTSQVEQGLEVPPLGRPKLYAPPEWNQGSSYSHLTEERVGGTQIYYPPGSANSLMTPRLGATEVIHRVGPVTCGMFRDMGWTLGPACEAELPEIEPPLEDAMIVVGPCPNPAVGGRTRVRVHVPEQQRIRADLFDVLGRRLQTVFDDRLLPSNPTIVNDRPICVDGGTGFIAVDGSGLASGVYFLRVRGDVAERTVRVTIIN